LMSERPETLFHFYKDKSQLHRNFMQPSPIVVGKESIHHKIMSLNLTGCKVSILAIDCQSSLENGIIILVVGYLTYPNAKTSKFIQTFFLAPQNPSGYYLLNDIFRVIEENSVVPSIMDYNTYQYPDAPPTNQTTPLSIQSVQEKIVEKPTEKPAEKPIEKVVEIQEQQKPIEKQLQLQQHVENQLVPHQPTTTNSVQHHQPVQQPQHHQQQPIQQPQQHQQQTSNHPTSNSTIPNSTQPISTDKQNQSQDKQNQKPQEKPSKNNNSNTNSSKKNNSKNPKINKDQPTTQQTTQPQQPVQQSNQTQQSTQQQPVQQSNQTQQTTQQQQPVATNNNVAPAVVQPPPRKTWGPLVQMEPQKVETIPTNAKKNAHKTDNSNSTQPSINNTNNNNNTTGTTSTSPPTNSKEKKDEKKDDKGGENGTKIKKSSSGASLFVRNLPYSVTQEQVKLKFQELGEIKSVTLKQGYAFVEFVSADVAKQVIKKTISNPVYIDKRLLAIEERRGKDSGGGGGNKKDGNSRRDKEGGGGGSRSEKDHTSTSTPRENRDEKRVDEKKK